MQKISGILPSNSRITKVDREGEHPLRSGHEARFGRKISKTEVVSRGGPKLTIKEAPKMFDKLSERKQRDQMHADIVRKMSNAFFGKTNEPEPVVEVTAPQVMASLAPEVKLPERNYVESYVDAEDYGDFTRSVEAAIDAESDFNTVGSNLSVVA